MAIDQSTAGTKALIVNHYGQVIAKSQSNHRQIYPKPGWVEHDPMEIYENVKRVALQVMERAGIESDRLAALSITNQRETAVMWDRTTGRPLYNAIVWQCQRTADRCAAYKSDGHEQSVRAKTGLRLDPYFSATKWSWMLEHAEDVERLLAEGKLMVGTIESWLVWKLTNGRVHATDMTNASRTSLYNIHTLRWDQELCGLFGIPIDLLPEVKSSDEVVGFTEDPDLFPHRVPISGIIGDSQAALFGQLCWEPGMAKATYGTGTSVLMNIGGKPADSDNGLVTTVAWARGGCVTYALESIIRSSGDSINWTRDNLNLFDSFDELDALLRQTPHNQGVYLVPAFVGLGAPYWAPHARAAIIGMDRSAGKAHIVRAAVESIAYQVRDATESMEQETGIKLSKLLADGGASDNAILMQFQADLLHIVVSKSEISELSALGSVYMAGLGVGFWSSPEEITRLVNSGVLYHPSMSVAEMEQLYAGWKEAVASVIG